MNSFYEACSTVRHSRKSGPKESGRPVGDRTPALMPWLVPYGQQSIAASQHASTRSQQDIASDATCSGAAAKAAELEPSSTAAVMMYFFMMFISVEIEFRRSAEHSGRRRFRPPVRQGRKLFEKR